MNRHILILSLCLAASLAAAQSAPPSYKETLEQIRKEARNDFQRTAQALQALDPTLMNAEDRASWVRLSRDTAIRLGDAATLRRLKDQPDPFGLMPQARLILANAHLSEGDFPAARATLDSLGELSRINSRDQRRYWALQARLAQLENRPQDERAALEHIVHELAHWASSNCQSCHNDPKQPQAVTLLEMRDSWYARRYVELLRQQGEAAALRRRASERLSAKPDDEDARIVLGFALLAEGRAAEAENCWREIPWIALPNRQGIASRALFAWP